MARRAARANARPKPFSEMADLLMGLEDAKPLYEVSPTNDSSNFAQVVFRQVELEDQPNSIPLRCVFEDPKSVPEWPFHDRGKRIVKPALPPCSSEAPRSSGVRRLRPPTEEGDPNGGLNPLARGHRSASPGGRILGRAATSSMQRRLRSVQRRPGTSTVPHNAAFWSNLSTPRGSVRRPEGRDDREKNSTVRANWLYRQNDLMYVQGSCDHSELASSMPR
mmetsp:Transcript_97038/g.182503  ORF Transcript_97038/g.182503 Transcript_97038/m.182503 type:complete len:221 (+) Transcript_97038:56-718(+)